MERSESEQCQDDANTSLDTRKTKENREQPLKNQIHQLSQQQVNQLEKGLISTQLRSASVIEKIAFGTKHQRVYRTQTISNNKKKENFNLNEMHLTQQSCLQLMISAITLISSIHEMGITLSENENLFKFLQVWSDVDGKSVLYYSMVELQIEGEFNYKVQPFKAKNDLKDSIFANSQLKLLVQFYQLLLERVKGQLPKHIKGVIDYLKESIEKNTQVQITSVLQKISCLEFVYQNFTFRTFLEIKKNQLFISIFDRRTEEWSNFIEIEKTSVDFGKDTVSVTELFLILASKQRDQLKIISNKRISFYDALQKMWKQLQFPRINDRKGKYEYKMVQIDEDSDGQQLDSKIFVYEAKNTQQQTSFILNQEEYPNNCVGIVEVHGHSKKQKYIGIGSIIRSNLILTAAHVISPSQQVIERLGGIKVIYFCWKKQRFVVQKHRHPEQFLNTKLEGQKDFALLHLAQKIDLPQYLTFAKSFKTANKIYLLTIRDKSQGKTVERQESPQPIQIENSQILNYNCFKTQVGYSGSPILIKSQTSSQFYIIAVHSRCQKNFNTGKCIQNRQGPKIDSENHNQICTHEKDLTKNKISFVNMMSQIQFQHKPQENKKKISNQLKINEKRLRFPYNCIGTVKSTFKQRQEQIERYEVGTLVALDLVLVCAHVIHYKLTVKSHNQLKSWSFKRSSAIKIEFTLNNEEYQVESYKCPKQFYTPELRQSQKQVKYYDFGLLKLKKRIELPRYIGIAKDYRTKNKLSFISRKFQRNEQIIQEQKQQHQLISNQSTIMYHPFQTWLGSAGSPLIVQLVPEHDEFYLIAIHNGFSYSRKKRFSTKMTKYVVERLIDFQKVLKNSDYSFIEQNSVDFQQKMKELLSGRKIQQSLTQDQQMELKKCKEQQARRQLVLLNGKYGNLLSKMQFKQKFKQLLEKYIKFLIKSKESIFKAQEQQKHMKKDILQDLIQYKDRFPSNCQDLEVKYFKDKVSQWINLLSQQKYQHFWKSFIDYQEMEVELNEERYKLFDLQFHTLALFSKFLRYEQMLQSETILVWSQLRIANLIMSIGKADQIQIANELLLLAQRYTEKNRLKALETKKTKQENQCMSSLLSPFYSIQRYWCHTQNNKHHYQFSIQMDFSNEWYRKQYLNQGIELVYNNFPFCIYNYPSDQTGNFSLYLKLKTNMYMPFREQTFPNSANLNQVFKFVKLLYKIIEFVCFLHEKGCNLCAPLQNCAFIDLSAEKVEFYYFGHHDSLCRKVQRMKMQFATMSQTEIDKFKEYYPVEEILSQKDVKESFKKIDVWMIGSSLKRIFQKLNMINKNSSQNNILKEMIEEMMAANPKNRITIAEVLRVVGEVIKTKHW